VRSGLTARAWVHHGRFQIGARRRLCESDGRPFTSRGEGVGRRAWGYGVLVVPSGEPTLCATPERAHPFYAQAASNAHYGGALQAFDGVPSQTSSPASGSEDASGFVRRSLRSARSRAPGASTLAGPGRKRWSLGQRLGHLAPHRLRASHWRFVGGGPGPTTLPGPCLRANLRFHSLIADGYWVEDRTVWVAAGPKGVARQSIHVPMDK
jgi:hypothetical protein